MSPSKAAEIIGCSAQHVRNLIRTGQIRAARVPQPYGHVWSIPESEVSRIRDTPTSGRGWPRGKSRIVKGVN